jgi:hypothetical protein
MRLILIIMLLMPIFAHADNICMDLFRREVGFTEQALKWTLGDSPVTKNNERERYLSFVGLFKNLRDELATEKAMNEIKSMLPLKSPLSDKQIEEIAFRNWLQVRTEMNGILKLIENRMGREAVERLYSMVVANRDAQGSVNGLIEVDWGGRTMLLTDKGVRFVERSFHPNVASVRFYQTAELWGELEMLMAAYLNKTTSWNAQTVEWTSRTRAREVLREQLDLASWVPVEN